MARRSDIERQAKSVRQIRNMTRSMQLVGQVKSRQSKRRLDQAFPFFSICAQTMASLHRSEQSIKSPLFHERVKKPGAVWRIGFYVFSGDRGMAGTFNADLLNQAMAKMHEKIAEREAEGYEVHEIVRLLGKVGYERLERAGFSMAKDFEFPIQEVAYKRVGPLSDLIRLAYQEERVDEVIFIFTRISPRGIAEQIAIPILPIDHNHLSRLYAGFDTVVDTPEHLVEPIYDPDLEHVLEYLVESYINGMIYGALAESSAAEENSRAEAMSKATDNADEILAKLQLDRNRVRQAGITQELTEISAGTESLRNEERGEWHV